MIFSLEKTCKPLSPSLVREGFGVSYKEQKILFFQAENLRVQSDGEENGGELTKEELDKIDSTDGNLDDSSLKDHVEKYLEKQLKLEKDSLAQTRDDKKLSPEQEQVFDDFEAKVQKLKKANEDLVSLNKFITELEGKLTDPQKPLSPEEQKQKEEQEKLKNLETDMSEDLQKVLTTAEEKIKEIDEKDFKVKGGTIIEKLWNAYQSGKLMDFMKHIFLGKRGESAINETPPVADKDLALATVLAEQKTREAGKENDEATLMFATMQSEGEFKLAQKGYKKAELQPNLGENSHYKTKENQTFRGALEDFLGSKDNANARIDEMKKMGIPLPTLDKPLPTNTHLYFGSVDGKNGYLVMRSTAEISQESLKSKTQSYYQKAKNPSELPKTRIEQMEQGLEPGDFILVRSSEGYTGGSSVASKLGGLGKYLNMGKIGKNAIETEQNGFDFTHVVTYLGDGKVFNIHGGKNAHITDLKTLMNDEILTTGEYVTLKNEHAKTSTEKDQFIAALKEQKDTPYGNLIKATYDRASVNGEFNPVCSGIIQTAFAKRLGKYPFGKDLTSPGQFYEKLKVLRAGNVRMN